MPPISIVFVTTGLAVWVIGLAFLGIGAKPSEEEGASNPMTTVGWIALIAGIVDIVQAAYIMAVQPAPLGALSEVLAGLVMFYGAFFTLLGTSLVKGLDLRPVANLSAAVAVVPLFWWQFFAGGWMFRSILVVWLIVFGSVTLTVYGKLSGKILGAMLVFTALYTFLTPAVILALGHFIP
ncbi:hypothetical protein [Nakamurella sp. PAMC28650]|uniref:hypothetical protein n=1 Tax=Nakamurella sp. PAMC28650 TaxID=2762325 RepID=UPI00164E5116|nr:hypothetical protein [Nakamurella sp. PAMC28650]QNK80075.1 hypothetical protein H7F38_17860 [Nakamurella sp. PAMC28650]